MAPQPATVSEPQPIALAQPPRVEGVRCESFSGTALPAVWWLSVVMGWPDNVDHVFRELGGLPPTLMDRITTRAPSTGPGAG